MGRTLGYVRQNMAPCQRPSAVRPPVREIAGDVILVAAPWPLFGRPSIQLATLKAYLASQFPEFSVTACHWYLNIAAAIGYTTYEAVCRRTWVAESVYAALLFPEKVADLAHFFQSQAPAGLKACDFQSLVADVKRSSRELIDQIEWGGYRLVGFSIGLCQLTASLYFIREVKAICSDLTVVVGGSTLAAGTARGLLTLFPSIDFAVCGEGERPLAELIRWMDKPNGDEDIPPEGVLSARTLDRPLSFNQVPDLDALPLPDFDDYFAVLAGLPAGQRFFPTLPLEMSRGCFWQSAGGGCAFCNLNQQWRGFRKKSAARIAAEAERLTRRHQTLSLAYTDNALPPGRQGREICRALADLHQDLWLFGEIKATTSRTTLKAMRDAGFDQVQIGIEALSTRLLEKINKGTSAMDNIAVLKHCQELGIRHQSNLILCLPGSDAADVAETLDNLSFVLGFEPLQPVRFWLGLGSPIWQSPTDYGLTAVFSHPNWGRLFPASICRSLTFGIQAYRGGLERQIRLWTPVRRELVRWKKEYDALQRQQPGQPALSWRDGGEFLIIHQRRLGDRPATHRLIAGSRRIYLFCDEPRRLEEICRLAPGLDVGAVRSFLKDMVAKKLMFAENDRYLSLAVRARRP